jgi:hypothetical protein
MHRSITLTLSRGLPAPRPFRLRFATKTCSTALALLVVGLIGPVALKASVPTTTRFDLTDNAAAVFTKKSLYDTYHVMQSFAWDNVHTYVYTVQVEGSDAAGTWSEHWANGDLTLTKLSADGNTVAGHMYLMYLRGFGHGVSIGVEPVGSSVYLWTEVDSQPNSEGSGRGTKLGRFLYSNGTTLTNTSSAITKFVLIPGVTQVTPSVDMAAGRLTMRYLTSSNQFRLALYDLAAVKAGGTSVLCDIAIPSGLGTFEGYTSYGSYVYLYTGTAYSDTNPPPGNTELYSFNWNTGVQTQHAHTDAFGSQVYREPEGMSVQVVSGVPRLVFGFSSSVSETDGHRVTSIAYKDLMIP